MNAFNLRRHYPTKIEYWASEDVYPDPIELAAQIGVNLGPNTTNPLDWRVSTTVIFSAKKDGVEICKGSVVFVGFFDIPDAIKEEDRIKFITTNGAAVLYSATRELVSNISSRSPNMHVVLPIASFQNMPVATNQNPAQIVSATV